MAYNARKAAQTIAYLCKQSGGDRINVLRAVKLVYLADREALRVRGTPIQSERYAAMPHGPVNSSTYDHIKGVYADQNNGWREFLRDRENHDVGLASTDIEFEDLDELSRSEMKILDRVLNQFKDFSNFELRDWTHEPENVPEWTNPNGSSFPISLEQIMASVGVDNPHEKAENFRAIKSVDDIFASL